LAHNRTSAELQGILIEIYESSKNQTERIKTMEKNKIKREEVGVGKNIEKYTVVAMSKKNQHCCEGSACAQKQLSNVGGFFPK